MSFFTINLSIRFCSSILKSHHPYRPYLNKIPYLCIHCTHGVDWFRQQGQWVSKHAENRSAISIIPCYKILTGNEEFALAA